MQVMREAQNVSQFMEQKSEFERRIEDLEAERDALMELQEALLEQIEEKDAQAWPACSQMPLALQPCLMRRFIGASLGIDVVAMVRVGGWPMAGHGFTAGRNDCIRCGPGVAQGAGAVVAAAEGRRREQQCPGPTLPRPTTSSHDPSTSAPRPVNTRP